MKKRYVSLFVLGVIITVCIVILIHNNHVKNSKLHRSFNMRSIGTTFCVYIDSYKKFPQQIFNEYSRDNHRQNCSWRFRCASYLGYGSGDTAERAMQSFDLTKNWNEAPNVSLWIPAYNWTGCPKSPKDHKRYWTNVMAITGPDTAFEVCELSRLEGCQDLIVVVEVADSGVHWGEPGDIDVNNLPENLTSGIDGDGFMVLFFDGSVWFIKKDVPIETLKNFLTITESKKHDRNIELKPYAIVYYESKQE